jgi:cytoskeletal protein CcmA (bactofilin family)
MFSKGKAPNPHANNTTLIAAGTTVTGNLAFSGNVEVEGKVVGDLVASDPGHGTVRVLAAGVVEGEIRAPTVIVNGTVNGDVHASEHVELAAKATVTGNVHYKLIEMVKGAQVNGNLVYAGGESPAPATARQSSDAALRDGDAAPSNT